MIEAILYLTDFESAELLEARRQACLNWALAHEVEICSVCIETGPPGLALRDRSVLLRLLMQLERGQTLLIYSRASLELNELALCFIELEVRERRSIIRSACEPDLESLLSPARQATLSNIVNEYRNQLLGGKIKTAIQERLSLGLRAGNIKLGHQADEDGRIEHNPSETDAILLVKSLRARGLSVEEVQEELTAQRIQCRSGRVPSIPTISRWTYYSLENQPAPQVKVKLEEKLPLLGEEILRLKDEGLSFVKICQRLSDLGYKSRTGKPLMPNQVRRIFLRLSK